MISLSVRGDRELAAKFQSFPKQLQASLVRKITGLAIALNAHIKRDELSGQLLHVQSGDLRDSINWDVVQEATAIIGRVFSAGNIPYAEIQEEGGTTPPHIIEATNAQALCFVMGGETVFAKRVNHPGSVIPGKHYMRTGLMDFKEKILSGMDEAAREAWK